MNTNVMINVYPLRVVAIALLIVAMVLMNMDVVSNLFIKSFYLGSSFANTIYTAFLSSVFHILFLSLSLTFSALLTVNIKLLQKIDIHFPIDKRILYGK